jgi:hypothetical protein
MTQTFTTVGLRYRTERRYPGADINATRAWDITAGEHDVVVAVIDTVDYQHLTPGNMWTNAGECDKDGKDDDQNGHIDGATGSTLRTYFDEG